MSGVPAAIVTGAAKRIGRAVALQLHADGYAVCLHYGSSAAEAEALAAELNAKRPRSAVTYGERFDLTGGARDERPLSARCAGLVDFCFSQFGRCDVLVNNASAYYATPLLAEDAGEDAEGRAAADLFGSNAIAPYHLIAAFARRQEHASLKERNVSVVNLVDAMTTQPLLGFTMYTMAKCALEGLTKSAALELAGANIRVNGVGPGLSVLPRDMPAEVQETYRKKIPLGQREASGDEIAAAISFLVSEKARYITGSIVNVDGGWSLTRA